MATKTFNAIAQSIINNILTVNPNVDIKIGEAVRDLFIDVQAAQLQALYSIVDFSSRGQSVLSARGQQLDRLGYNFFITRNPATRSVGAVTLIIKNGVQAPTLINVGDQFYTSADQTGTAYVFICSQTTLLTTGLTQVTIPVVALNAGSTSNVPANAITQCNYDFVDSLYNIEPTSGGTDEETDAQFAARIPSFITGSYINTYSGITKILYGVANVSPYPYIITANHTLSRGPYTVDVYLRRSLSYFGTPVQETAPANATVYVFKQQPLYELNPINQITVYNASTNSTQVIPPTIGGVTQYQVAENPSDADMLYYGSTKAQQQLQWLVPAPIYPYVVDYNVDQTIIDAQKAFDQYSEVVSDVLFRQALAVPIWISASAQRVAGASNQQIASNAGTNLLNLFASLGLTASLAPNNVVYAMLSDRNLTNVNITNLDTSYEVVLTASGTDGNYIFGVSLPNSNFLANHQFTPLDMYYDNIPAQGIFQPFTVAGRLFLTNPNRISSPTSMPDLVSAYPGTGVIDADLIQAITTNWGANVDTYYDSRSQTLVVNFDVAPTLARVQAASSGASAPAITFKMVQPILAATGALSYLVLAPSLVSPLVPFPGQQTSNPVFATVCPDTLDANRANVYKNGVALVQSPDNIVGDYTISSPDSNGVYSIKFLSAPLSTDILQFGLLNPDLTLS